MCVLKWYQVKWFPVDRGARVYFYSVFNRSNLLCWYCFNQVKWFWTFCSIIIQFFKSDSTRKTQRLFNRLMDIHCFLFLFLISIDSKNQYCEHMWVWFLSLLHHLKKTLAVVGAAAATIVVALFNRTVCYIIYWVVRHLK